ncbi:hypothetical protein HanIR_Chr11g0508581 [Helianthus annuus]|nr:hypothetical protein HanIR_Chr11g0508581 [Helianthus annuus]
MLIVARYETEPASLEYFYRKTLYSYTAEEAAKMQSEVSIVIKDEMHHPTIISFLRILTNISQEDYKNLCHLWLLQLLFFFQNLQSNNHHIHGICIWKVFQDISHLKLKIVFKSYMMPI